ncbi:MAG TPA: metalloregulator ArsR/SmtB family transcription factor [Egibacteraceae bacterium]|nr:metalloregulator ArsR/SmtB family transcription factor [Egibacteraceae bacterium]
MDILQVIAEPRRREILRLVRDQELTVGDITSRFDLTGPAISQHLRVLREAGLLDERREGTRRFYRARPEGFAELAEFVGEFWDARLPRLKRQAERDNRPAS